LNTDGVKIPKNLHFLHYFNNYHPN